MRLRWRSVSRAGTTSNSMVVADSASRMRLPGASSPRRVRRYTGRPSPARLRALPALVPPRVCQSRVANCMCGTGSGRWSSITSVFHDTGPAMKMGRMDAIMASRGAVSWPTIDWSCTRILRAGRDDPADFLKFGDDPGGRIHYGVGRIDRLGNARGGVGHGAECVEGLQENLAVGPVPRVDDRQHGRPRLRHERHSDGHRIRRVGRHRRRADGVARGVSQARAAEPRPRRIAGAPHRERHRSEGSVVMHWLVLLISAVLEAVWATALGMSDGFSRPVPTVVFAVGVTLSMLGLGWAMREIPIGTAYAVWTG